jgi:hypothetical protein
MEPTIHWNKCTSCSHILVHHEKGRCQECNCDRVEAKKREASMQTERPGLPDVLDFKDLFDMDNPGPWLTDEIWEMH